MILPPSSTRFQFPDDAPADLPEEPPSGLPFLLVGVADEVFGVPFFQVREVILAEKLVVASEAPAGPAGMFYRDGRNVPLFDLRVIRARCDPIPTNRRCVVISAAVASWHGATVGLLVDSVGPVVSLAPDEVVPAGDFGDPRADLLRGIARVNSERRMLLHLNRLLVPARFPFGARRS